MPLTSNKHSRIFPPGCLSPEEKGFTLIELIIIVIIVAVLSALAMPQFATVKERNLDKEAKANLVSLQEAESIYYMENAAYYPAAGNSTSVISNINANLKVSLPANGVNWSYTLVNIPVSNAKASRIGAGGRTWMILLPATSSDVPTCSGTGCP